MNDGPHRENPVFSVSDLVGAAKLLLEEGLGSVAVEGEVSNLSRPRSGHVYFTLKDAGAQLRCALFQREALRVRFPLADGLKVLARGRLSIYPARGDFQLYVAELEEAGLGALQRAFEQLKQRLAEEGLFSAELKRPLPRFPRRIGVVTSATGAALRDILHVLARRYPPARVLIYPTPVQGESAAASIVAALSRASARADCDVLILARGGGSLEDLWPFNTEIVARAIRASRIPVITGVGHETDFTIADFAADCRAPTPSAAAETVVPDAAELQARLAANETRLARAWRRAAQGHGQALRTLSRRLAAQHPRRRVQERAQRLDELAGRLTAAAARSLQIRGAGIAARRSDLARLSPRSRMHRDVLRLATLRLALAHAGGPGLERRRAGLAAIGARLQALGPEQTLARGYAIVFDAQGRVLRDARTVVQGARIRARLARGEIGATVEEVR
ncbi:MAG TPA: exodeoxyribonuclease VII large subunit [Gammaproteobacteria bacterium]|nr:exodeoxyribonuclease VII large subunit [Gammaproteobacteria bacterium]